MRKRIGLFGPQQIAKKNAGEAPLGVNYNTYALGREGYFSLDLLTDADQLNADKAHSLLLLGALEYDKGKAYEDFDASSDRIAAYGITALIAGVGHRNSAFRADRRVCRQGRQAPDPCGGGGRCRAQAALHG